MRRAISKRFSEAERSELEKLMGSEISFIDHPKFHPPAKAQKKLFEADDDPIPQSEVGWYMSYMGARDNLISWDSSKRRNVLLTKEQETRLFLRYNFAKFMLQRLLKEVERKGMSIGRGRKMLHWHRISSDIRHLLAESNLAMVLSVAKQFARKGATDDDIVGVGNHRLLIAIDGFDVSQNNKFSTYAWWAIMRAIIRRRQNEMRRWQKTREYSPDRETPEQVENPDDTGEIVEAMRHIINNNLAQLTARENFVIKKRFFELRRDGSRFNLSDVGKMLKLSRTCIQMAERSALAKLKTAWRNMLG